MSCVSGECWLLPPFWNLVLMNGVPFSNHQSIQPDLGRISARNSAHFRPSAQFHSSEQPPTSLDWLASDLERITRLPNTTLPPVSTRPPLFDENIPDDYDAGSFDPWAASPPGDRQITRTELSRSYLSRRDDSLSVRSTHNECDDSERDEWGANMVSSRPSSAQSNRSAQSNLSNSSFKELMSEVVTRVGRAMIPQVVRDRFRGGNRLGTSGHSRLQWCLHTNIFSSSSLTFYYFSSIVLYLSQLF